MKKVLVIIGVVAVLAATTFIGFKIGQRNPLISPTTDFLRDTLIIYQTDTVRVSTPLILTEKVTDTIRVPVTDTVTMRDTLYLNLPRTEKVYASEDYRAVVSGYQPSLDTIDIYKRTEIVTITQTPKPKRWGVGVQAGVGLNTQFKPMPYVGVGISYNIIQF